VPVFDRTTQTVRDISYNNNKEHSINGFNTKVETANEKLIQTLENRVEDLNKFMQIREAQLADSNRRVAESEVELAKAKVGSE